MLPDRVSNPGPPTYESGALPIALRGPAGGGGSWVRYPVWQHTFVSPFALSRRAVVSYWRKYVHNRLGGLSLVSKVLSLVNRLGGLSLPRKSVVKLTDHPDMTLDVYRGRETTIQQRFNKYAAFCVFISLFTCPSIRTSTSVSSINVDSVD